MTRLQAFVAPFNSFNFFVRHHNSEGEINELENGLIGDFSWKEVFVQNTPDGRAVAFESKNKPGFRLRHKNFRIVLDPMPTQQGAERDQFLKDSTFIEVDPLDGDPNDGWHSYRAWNFGDRYFAHTDGHLWLRQRDEAKMAPDAIFRPQPE
ncbi:AbfB domain-containing protein [Streptomyces sp. Tue6028]|uniref:AbfB domain-containing protein n=1 Tax=Streptomyces sp. Tue6028 TaxID=2036037 RepID=UPI003D75F5CC